MPTAILAAALAATNCTAPLGPGYTIERQRLDVVYVSTPQPRVEVRASWRVKNTGHRPLPAVELKLPDANTHGRNGLHLESGGVDVTPSDAQAANSVSIAFQSPLAVKTKQEIAVSYVLAGTPGEASGVVVHQRGFVLPPGDWAPALLPPKGTFTRGGGPRQGWEMTVRVPAGFHVHASGRQRGQKEGTDGVVFRFEQRREGVLPFAVGGAYQEARLAAAGREVIVWTLHAIPPDLAQRAAEAVARTAQFYDTEFGTRDAGAQGLWIIECPTGENCRPVPGAVVPGLEIYSPQFWQAGLPAMARQLAFTWLDFRVRANEETEPLPMGALTDYAADLAAGAPEGGDPRQQAVRRLVLRLSLLAGDDQGTGILSVRLSDPQPIRRYAGDKSELFFFALGDAAGKDNLQRALQHLLHAYRGREWRAADLRAAVEQESGKDFAGFFRKWLTEPGVPKESQNPY